MLCICDLTLWWCIILTGNILPHRRKKKCNQHTRGTHYQSCPTTILFLPWISCRSCVQGPVKLESWESINPVSLITRNLTDQRTSPPIVTSKPGLYRFLKAIFSSLLRSTTTETLEMELKKRVQNAAPVILKSSQPTSSQLWPLEVSQLYLVE